MRRVGGLLERVAEFSNLHTAYRRARRGKRHRESVDRFSFHLERELLRLRRELLDGSYRPGPLATFEVRDPKPRLIAAAPFRDRVLHQALLGVLEPHFERWLDPDSYASRKGRGVDPALRRALALTRRASWVLKSDIERCFASIDHEVLKGLLQRRFKDPGLLALLERIVDSGGEGGRGLPIGSLTSQWLANLTLGELDRFVRRAIRPAGYLRYMDDFALLDRDREKLKAACGEIALWLRDRLRLGLKERATGIHPARRGWPFLGFRVLPGELRLRRETWRRFRWKLAALEHAGARGTLSPREVSERAASMIAHLERGRSRGLRRRELGAREI